MIVTQTLLFAVLFPGENPVLAAKIQSEYPQDHLQITSTQWFIAAPGTAIDLSGKLGITDGSSEAAIVLAVSSYYGRAGATIWDWIALKIGSPKGGN